jgi:hypothetical protein
MNPKNTAACMQCAVGMNTGEHGRVEILPRILKTTHTSPRWLAAGSGSGAVELPSLPPVLAAHLPCPTHGAAAAEPTPSSRWPAQRCSIHIGSIKRPRVHPSRSPRSGCRLSATRGATILGSGGSKVCSATTGTVSEGRRYRSESSGGTKDAWERWPTARRAAMKTH